MSNMRSKPMKVLAMGLGRTGTKSLAAALKEHGFTPYDFPDRFRNGHLPDWDKAMRAKFYGIGKPLGRDELDQLTGDFDCVLDMPCCFFVEEFCKAYPDAKVILNTRDVESWLRSLQETVFKMLRWPSFQVLRYTDPSGAGTFMQHAELIWEVFCDGDYDDQDKLKKRFLEHAEHVRQVVPKDRLLEYRIQQGWEPLVKFLDLGERNGSLPRENGQSAYIEMCSKFWKFVVFRSFKNLIKLAVILSGVIGSILYLRSRIL